MSRRKLSRRRLLKAFATGSAGLVTGSFLSSCAATPAPGATQAPAAEATAPAKVEQKFTLQVMEKFFPEYLDWAADNLEPQWRESFPGGSVEYIPVDWNTLEEQLLTSKAAGAMPDLFRMGAQWVPVVADNELALPLDDRLADWPDTSDFFPSCIQSVTWRGKVWGMPDITAPRDNSYRKDLSDESGVVIPDDWTWDDYIDAAAKLTIREDGKMVRMGATTGTSFFEWLGVLWSGGGRLFSNGKAAFNSDAGIWALNWMRDRNNAVAPEGTAPLSESPIPYVATGQVVINYYQASWSAAQLKKYAPDKLEYLTLPLPPLKEKRIVCSLTDWLAISITSKVPDAAWEFLKLHCSVESLLVYVGSSGDLPPRKSAVGQSEYMNMPIVKQVADEMDTYGHDSVKMPSSERFIKPVLTPMIEAVSLHIKTAEEAAAEAEVEINRLLEEYPEWPDTEP
ncbi:MAG: sugar ABC transporter substrate-binding protein [Anaerolineae bacterium]|nr:sugar ABC transporter substrate-binding protein [Anaerolineae bacterium]